MVKKPTDIISEFWSELLKIPDDVWFSIPNFSWKVDKKPLAGKKQTASEFFRISNHNLDGIPYGNADGFAYCIGGILTLVTSCLLKVGQMI